MSVSVKDGSLGGEPYSIRFRAQFGDIGPLTFEKTELSLEALAERAYESWPKEDESVASLPLCKEDIKFIRNGRVLTSAEDLRHACDDYFSLNPPDDEGDKVLILHAVVRPPKPPVRKKGKKKVDSRQSSESATDTMGGVDCSCCVIM